jgi:hypothetical protein
MNSSLKYIIIGKTRVCVCVYIYIWFKSWDRLAAQQLHNNVDGIFILLFFLKKKGFDSCTTLIQQLHNNSSHEGGLQCVGPTFMWGVVVQLLYWCCKSNIFLKKNAGDISIVVQLLCKSCANNIFLRKKIFA